jgi:hypothetical protein
MKVFFTETVPLNIWKILRKNEMYDEQSYHGLSPMLSHPGGDYTGDARRLLR